MYISFDEKDQQIVRKLAEKKYGGKKGAISSMLHDVLHEYLQREREKNERESKVRKFREFLETGFKGHTMNLKGKKLWENRGELYDR